MILESTYWQSINLESIDLESILPQGSLLLSSHKSRFLITIRFVSDLSQQDSMEDTG